MDTANVKLEEVVVNGEVLRNQNSVYMGFQTFNARDILRMPVLFGEPDIIKTIQAQPGVSQGMEGFTGLYVRGGENDQNLFLYNGLPLYHVSHLGGVFSSFNAATIQKADFYKAAFPARYGGRASSIIDITMRSGDNEQLHGRMSLGLLSGNVYLSGPLRSNKTTFSLGLRRSWLDLISAPTLAIMNAIKKKDGIKYIAVYNFTDFNARIDHRFSSRWSASLLGYYGRDNLKIGQRDFESTASSFTWDPITGTEIQNTKEDPFYDQDENRLSWGNWGVLAKLKYCIGSHSFLLNGYYSDYTSLYRQSHEWQSDMKDENTHGYNKSRTENYIRDIGVSLAYDATLYNIWRLQAGASWIHHYYLPEKLQNLFFSDNKFIENNNVSSTVMANEGVVFIDNTVNPLDLLAINTGLRSVVYKSSGRKLLSWLEPRATVRLRFANDFSLKISYSHMVQTVQQVSNNYINLPTDLWQPVCTKYKPLESDQYSIGAYGILPWYDIWFSAEAWYKSMFNLVEYSEGVSVLNPGLSWFEKITTGKGWGYGLDLAINGKSGSISCSLGYGLMWNWRKFETLNLGKKFPSKFDNRHKLNLITTWHISDKIELNANWIYSTGNWLTLSMYNYEIVNGQFPDGPLVMPPNEREEDGIDWYSHRNNVRMPAYHRLDLGLTIHQSLSKGRRVEWNFSIYNAYCHMNAITIKKDNANDYWWTPIKQWHRAFKTLSFIPIIPSVSYTYIF